jgi:uncharacterized membrane protein YphA (DoxX/SURF4 family)
MINIILSDACALFFLWIFIQAGLHKISKNNEQYYGHLVLEYFNLYQGIDEVATKSKNLPWIHKIVKLIGFIELCLAVAIVIPVTRYIATFFIIFALLVYMLLMSYQILQGNREMNCGCGGSANQLKISSSLLVRNFIFSLIALLCLSPGQSALSSTTFVIFVIALFVILLNLTIEQLIANSQKISLLRH